MLFIGKDLYFKSVSLCYSVSRKNCYMVSAGDLQQRYGGSGNQDVSSKRSSPGLLIGCTIDTSTGILAFSVNGKEVANKFQVEPGSKLFPAVVCEPTIKEMLQFELGSTRVSTLTVKRVVLCPTVRLYVTLTF